MKNYNLLDILYKHRFNEKEIIQKNKIWKILCRYFLNKYITKNDIVLDAGTGFGEFINNICCKEKYAVDANEENAKFLAPGIKFFKSRHNNFSFLVNDSMDVIFMSNFSEHLLTKDDLLHMILEARRVLRPGGRLIILGPNIRYAYKEYWDFFDHHIPLSHRAIAEVLEALNFKITKLIPRFLPYTTKSNLPKSSFFVWFYLKFPFLWLLAGKQMFIVAVKQGN
ncbi:MAG: class I SAM-dependent methyltransferase [Candidatus Omnitrophota bacterium]|nr:class I SAM-dependent methyltransferase [Candidatus Omnitrophota bacterium]